VANQGLCWVSLDLAVALVGSTISEPAIIANAATAVSLTVKARIMESTKQSIRAFDYKSTRVELNEAS